VIIKLTTSPVSMVIFYRLAFGIPMLALGGAVVAMRHLPPG
jgi:hypothetical protein